MPGIWERMQILAALVAAPIAITAAVLGYHWWAEQIAEEPRIIKRVAVVAQPDPVEQTMRSWKDPPPELVLAFSGQMYGYLQPCGCARPQVGGLERRYEFVHRLRQAGWPVLGFDLGDLVRFRHEIKSGVPALAEQSRLKYETALKMLQQLEWQAVGVGVEELLFPLDEVFGWALNIRPPTLLCTNLDWPEMQEIAAYRRFLVCEAPGEQQKPHFLSQTELRPLPAPGTADFAKFSKPRRTWRIACLSVIQQSELPQLRQKFSQEPEWLKRFLAADLAISQIAEPIKQSQPDLVILLHHGSVEQARQLAQQFGWIHLIVNRDESDVASSLAEPLPDAGSESRGVKAVVQNRLLVRVGHKGKALGLVAVRPTEAHPNLLLEQALGFRLDYRMVELTEVLEPPSNKTNPVRELMKEYVYQVYARKLLEQWVSQRQVSHPQQLDQPGAAFVGAQACAACHRSACQVWNHSKHSQAYLALVQYGQPQTTAPGNGQVRTIGRQYDPECLICHTTGFEYKTGFRSETATPQLLGNGCENCHGPASLHVKFAEDPKYWQPLKRTAAAVANTCRACHDSENDPHFDFGKYWPKIAHKKD